MKENNQNENNNQSKQILLSVLAVAILVVAVVGISFAAFVYTKQGDQTNTITTGTITMEYTEGDNVIAIENAMPLGDTEGKAMTATDANGAGTIAESATDGTPAAVFDFTVKATISGTTTINYEIGAQKVDVTTVEPAEGNGNVGTKELGEEYVKLYLVGDEAGGSDYTQKTAPTTYKALTAGQGERGQAPATDKVIGSGTFSGTGGTHNYELKMWVSDEFDMNTLNAGGKVYKGQFKVKVNVYGAAA